MDPSTLIELETAYSEKIDCRLNYNSFEEMKILFEEAKSISHQSVFRFLEEVVRPPRSKKLKNKKNFLLILNFVNLSFDHPVKWLVFHIGTSMLNDQRLPLRKVLNYMKELKRFHNFYSVLNLLSYSVRFNSRTNMVDDFHDEIVNYWMTQSSQMNKST